MPAEISYRIETKGLKLEELKAVFIRVEFPYPASLDCSLVSVGKSPVEQCV